MSDNPLADPLAWRHIKAPSLVDLEIMAREEFARLPEMFRARCTDLVIQIEDFATDEVLDDMRIESPFELDGAVSRRRPAVPIGKRAHPYAEHGLALPTPDPGLLGGA